MLQAQPSELCSNHGKRENTLGSSMNTEGAGRPATSAGHRGTEDLGLGWTGADLDSTMFKIVLREKCYAKYCYNLKPEKLFKYHKTI